MKLYNNQVFVADNIKEVIPEFLLLLKGVIDCPDLPLNVSRSFLQNDGYVRKMSAYITRKVADRLLSEFNNNREEYQRYWDDIHPFVKYGFMRDDKFYDRAKKALLFKTTAGTYLTLEEYRNRNADGDECTVYYTSDEKRQAQMIKLYTDQGKDVVLLNTLIDANFISFLEYAEHDDKITFKRVDAAADGLTEDGETSEDERKQLETLFRAAVKDDQLDVQLKPFKADDMIAMITVDEQNRRFAEMSARWGGPEMNLPQKRTLLLNSKHPLVSWLKTAEAGENTDAVCEQIVDLAARRPHCDFRVQQAGRTDDLFDNRRAGAALDVARRRADEDGLTDMLPEFVEFERPVVERRVQTKAVFDKALLSRTVARVHRAHLRKRDV